MVPIADLDVSHKATFEFTASLHLTDDPPNTQLFVRTTQIVLNQEGLHTDKITRSGLGISLEIEPLEIRKEDL